MRDLVMMALETVLEELHHTMGKKHWDDEQKNEARSSLVCTQKYLLMINRWQQNGSAL